MTRSTLLARYGLPPEEIQARSLRLVEEQADAALPIEPRARKVAIMMLYATGDPGLAAEIRVHSSAIDSGLAALRAGCKVVVDVRMGAAAVDRASLNQLGCELVCAIEHPESEATAHERGITWSAAAMDLLADDLGGAVVVVGNAPTALLALLDAVDEGRAQPSVIVGTPVGLIAASEAKEELVRRSIPYVTVLGTRGGSAIAGAALNTLLILAREG